MEFRTEQEILFKMINYAEENNLINLPDDYLDKISNGEYIFNQYILDLSVHAKILEEFEEKCNEIFNNINLNLATGIGLDNLGNLVNVNRLPAKPAIVDITLSVDSNENNNIEIPAGTSLLLDEIYSNRNSNFITSEPAILSNGVTSVTIRAESLDYGIQQKIPAGAIVGVENYPNISVTNENDSTIGSNIEEDDDYRLRIAEWGIKNSIGTEQNIKAYLGEYIGLDSYKLIPRYNGIGTLKIVCETLQSELENIQNGVNTNCMIATDEPAICVLPTVQTLQNLTIYAHLKENTLNSNLLNEIQQTLVAQTNTYISGGLTRSGDRIKSIGVGSDFYPSNLVNYLLNQVPECANIRTDVQQVISVPDTNIFTIDSISVEFE